MPHPARSDLSVLAQRAARGDVAALDAFVSASYDHVWRFCASLVGRQGADDVAQETFVRAVRALPAFRGESSARTWLLGIARHVCQDEWRARERSGRLGAVSSQPEPVHADAAGATVALDLIDRLSQERRTAFVLTQLLGLTYDEAAGVCECAVGTIRSRVARARRDLIDMLDDAEMPTRTTAPTGAHARRATGPAGECSGAPS